MKESEEETEEVTSSNDDNSRDLALVVQRADNSYPADKSLSSG